MTYPLSIILYALLIGELPVILFTALDILKFKYLIKYRHNNRRYPYYYELWKGLVSYLFITFFILIPITYVGINLIEIFKINIFRISPDIHLHISLIEYFSLTILSEIFFYSIHRVMHHPILYRYHRFHHTYINNSFSLVNHNLDILESLIFIIPPLLPALIIKPHILVFGLFMILTNWIGTYIHSGYNFWFINRLLLVDSIHHDNHHLYKTKNFGLGIGYSILDKCLNTYK